MALGDPTGIISDTMDELGIPCGVIGASVLRPTIPGTTIVGPALTVRNILQRIDPLRGRPRSRQPDGGIRGPQSRPAGRRAGDPGGGQRLEHGRHFRADRQAPGRGWARSCKAGVRDIAHSRAVGYPIWASDITPVTGKWRLETVEINGPIQIGEVRVAAGDLVIADDTGVCFIPRDIVLEVLEAAEQKAKAEAPGARRSTTACRCPRSRARPTAEK